MVGVGVLAFQLASTYFGDLDALPKALNTGIIHERVIAHTRDGKIVDFWPGSRRGNLQH